MGAPFRVTGHGRLRTGLVVVGVLVLLLALSQLLLPVIAVKLVRDRVGRYGTVKSASISAWPAIELLWGKAESASLSAGHIALTSAQLTELTGRIWEARGVEKARMSAERASVAVSGLAHALHASDVRAEKDGPRISGSATITQQALDEASPNGFRLQPVASANGEVEVHASGGLFGAQMSIGALIKPLEGRLVVQPQGLPFAQANITLLSAPHLKVEAVAMEVVQREPPTYRLSFKASLR